MSSLASSDPGQRVQRSSFDIGSLVSTALISNQTQAPWLTVYNVGSGSLVIGAAAQVVGALKQRSFYVADDDPIQVLFAWAQRNASIVTQPGQKTRSIPYALSDAPLAALEEEDIYSTPSLLVCGDTPGNSTTVITPGAGECFTHIDAAIVNAQAAGDQQDIITASYGQGLAAIILQPPKGASRQVVRIDGPVAVNVVLGSPTARCDWQVYGVANVVR